MTSVFLFAHQDDEVGIAPSIVSDLRAGRDVWCVYLTNGQTKSVASKVRCNESRRVLLRLGVARDRIVFIGVQQGIDDGTLINSFAQASSALQDLFSHISVGRVYTLAWEGGHPDHDATHLIALAFARLKDAETLQYSLYNAFGKRNFFNVMRPLPQWRLAIEVRLSLRDAWRFTHLCVQYRSQWRTWVGLTAGVALEFLVRRRHRVYAVNPRDASARPHAGGLLYERMFHVSFEAFYSTASDFMIDAPPDCAHSIF